MVKVAARVTCPACMTPLSSDGGSAGLCPGCLLELALDDTSLEAELQPGEAPTLQFASGETFSEGDIEGERYRIRSLLGRGGMGEVWRAYDLKLRLDVALKALRTELIADKYALETLRQEVRVAREVISPNVCRVFDLQELDGQELISMEYVDGTTLQEILKERGPLELNEAREIASQFLAGLEAIHEAGLVHRDIKPENLMLTRTGRVVVMDFGIAKGLGEGESGMVAGTPAYMSPEQARGRELDARADLYSAGIVLAEMVEPGGVGSFEDRKRVWEGIHQKDPRVSETPWSKVIAQTVCGDQDSRFKSASTLARALEEVTLRASGDETARPYPGLSAFQQEDAEYFYGRELEVEALWKKLRRPHLLAVIGPSGAGKSSFLRAGLLPTLTDGWQAIMATPGNRPFANLARSLAEQLPVDSATIDALLSFEDPEVAIKLISQWREGGRRGLIALDQFEELFTQNPEGAQASFAELLGRLPLEADVHVLLSMRDDFLYHCHRYEAFQPILSDLTLLGPPTGASMRRAIVEPALRCGYRFEDESIVEEMLAEVEGERGALPMVAFSAAQLWEHRDRESGLLTRETYERIGGVGGALAQHAEAILELIGEDGIPIVRELFRNLVTAQGTRAARDREELLSVFGGHQPLKRPASVPAVPASDHATAGTEAGRFEDPNAAETVLDSLINARLLTSYETPGSDNGDTPHHHIEIVHESLLANWPSLVRWQTQDAEGAQIRDELRSQAKLWDEHGRSEDYLWTGTAFKEYELWRERYPGGLTDTEEVFAEAMTSLATRRKRRRRIVVAASLVIAVVVASAMGVLWRQSEADRLRAETETLRAEAGKLLALGELEIDSYPTAALAWATKSLEKADTLEGRLLALRALYKGPPVTVATPAEEEKSIRFMDFSPGGEWLATESSNPPSVWLRHRDGGEPIHLFSYPDGAGRLTTVFESEDVLVANQDGDARWFSVPDGKEIRPAEEGRGQPYWGMRGDGYFSVRTEQDRDWFTWWPLGGGEPREVGSMETLLGGTALQRSSNYKYAVLAAFDVDTTGSWLVFKQGREVFVRSLEDWSQAPRRIGEHDADVDEVMFHPSGDRVVATDASGTQMIWSTPRIHPSTPEPLRRFQGASDASGGGFYDSSGRWLAQQGMEGGHVKVWLWDTSAPRDVEPLVLSRTDVYFFDVPRFNPSEPWMALTGVASAGLWPLSGPYPWVMRVDTLRASGAAFSLDGRWLVVSGIEELRAWPLDGQNNGTSRVLAEGFPGWGADFCFHPSGEYLAVMAMFDDVVSLVPFAGGSTREMPGEAALGPMTFSPNGRLFAMVPWQVGGNELGVTAENMVIRVWDIETDEVRRLGPLPGDRSAYLGFDDDRRIRWSGSGTDERPGGERIYDLEDGSVEIVEETSRELVRRISSDGKFMIVLENGPEDEYQYVWKSRESNESRRITSHGDKDDLGGGFAIDPSDQWIVTGGGSSLVRVGPVSGEEPHLMFGHKGAITAVAFSPDGRWIASSGLDGTARVWPMPDMSKPPLHTLPHDELIVRLHSLTNVRIVEDPESSTGWKLDYAPFPGWAEVPEW